jgi:DNA gyrase subunit A
MVVADPDATLLTVCEHGYGKRTPFGPNASAEETTGDDSTADDSAIDEPTGDEAIAEDEVLSPQGGDAADDESGEEEGSTSARYPTKRRGGIGVRDIKTTARNGEVIAIASVDDLDEVLMMTARGKLQRIKASDISVIGRNTQGVRIMSLDEDDTLIAAVRVPPEVEETPAARPTGRPTEPFAPPGKALPESGSSAPE